MVDKKHSEDRLTLNSDISASDDNSSKTAIDRTPRAKKIRSKETRRKPWSPPSVLDSPPPPDGFRHRWIRAETRGFDDTKNISSRLREGWELVRKDEYPDFELPVVDAGKYKGVFGVGGLILARIPEETASERNAYYSKLSNDQMEAVDSNMMRENDHPSMRIFKPDRQSQTNFGGIKR